MATDQTREYKETNEEMMKSDETQNTGPKDHNKNQLSNLYHCYICHFVQAKAHG